MPQPGTRKAHSVLVVCFLLIFVGGITVQCQRVLFLANIVGSTQKSQLLLRRQTQDKNTHVVAHVPQRLQRGDLDALVELPGDVVEQRGKEFRPLVLRRHTHGCTRGWGIVCEGEKKAI